MTVGVYDAHESQFYVLWLNNGLDCDKGSKYDQPKDAGKLHKVFVAFSPAVAEMLRKRKIMIDF